MIDIHKYDNKMFSINSEIDKKVKALLLRYDYDQEAFLQHKYKVQLINDYIKRLIYFEEFETVIALKDKKHKLLTAYKKERRTGSILFKLHLFIWKRNITSFFSKMF